MDARSALVATLCLSLSHCYSSYELAPHALDRLDKFHGSTNVEIESTDGPITFDRNTALRFDQPAGPIEGKFSSVTVDDSVFQGVERKSQSNVIVDLQRVDHVTATKFSTGKTVALAIVASIVGTVAIGFLAIWIGLATNPTALSF